MVGDGEEAECSAPPLSPHLPPAVESHILGRLVPNFSSVPHTDPPSVSAVNAVVLAAAGREAMLVCEASGQPPPRVIWYRGAWGGEKGLQNCPTRALEGQLSRTAMGQGILNGVSGRNGPFQQPPAPQPKVHTAGAGVRSKWFEFGSPGDLVSVLRVGKPQMAV